MSPCLSSLYFSWILFPSLPVCRLRASLSHALLWPLFSHSYIMYCIYTTVLLLRHSLSSRSSCTHAGLSGSPSASLCCPFLLLGAPLGFIPFFVMALPLPFSFRFLSAYHFFCIPLPSVHLSYIVESLFTKEKGRRPRAVGGHMPPRPCTTIIIKGQSVFGQLVG